MRFGAVEVSNGFLDFPSCHIDILMREVAGLSMSTATAKS
jgi:hypothetical protein